MKGVGKWKVAGLVAAVGVFLFFVWPTPFVYSPHESGVLRANRFTGKQEISSLKGWRPYGGVPQVHVATVVGENRPAAVPVQDHELSE